MKKVAIWLGVMMVVLCFFAYGRGYLYFHQTKISDEEIFIGRIGTVPFSYTEYAVNLDTGDEEILIQSFLGQSWFIYYGGECQCITRVSKVDIYYVELIVDYIDERQVFLSSGGTVHRTVPYEQVRHVFEEGLTMRNILKERYADILSS